MFSNREHLSPKAKKGSGSIIKNSVERQSNAEAYVADRSKKLIEAIKWRYGMDLLFDIRPIPKRISTKSPKIFLFKEMAIALWWNSSFRSDLL